VKTLAGRAAGEEHSNAVQFIGLITLPRLKACASVAHSAFIPSLDL
jgi:hypothetical protein